MFEAQEILNGDISSLAINELAYSASTCRLLVEIGIFLSFNDDGAPVLTDSNPNLAQERETLIDTHSSSVAASSVGDESYDSGSNALGNGSTFNSTRPGYKARTRSRVLDSPGPVTSRTEIWVRWYPTASCAWNGSAPVPTGYQSQSWLSGSGWVRDRAVHDVQGNCTRVFRRLHAFYYNDPFYGPPSGTLAHHWPTYVEGTKNTGSHAPSNHSWNTTKSGGCSRLLRVENVYWYSHRFQ